MNSTQGMRVLAQWRRHHVGDKSWRDSRLSPTLSSSTHLPASLRSPLQRPIQVLQKNWWDSLIRVMLTLIKQKTLLSFILHINKITIILNHKAIYSTWRGYVLAFHIFPNLFYEPLFQAREGVMAADPVGPPLPLFRPHVFHSSSDCGNWLQEAIMRPAINAGQSMG